MKTHHTPTNNQQCKVPLSLSPGIVFFFARLKGTKPVRRVVTLPLTPTAMRSKQIDYVQHFVSIHLFHLCPGGTAPAARMIPTSETSDGGVAVGGHVERFLRPLDALLAGARQKPLLFRFSVQRLAPQESVSVSVRVSVSVSVSVSVRFRFHSRVFGLILC